MSHVVHNFLSRIHIAADICASRIYVKMVITNVRWRKALAEWKAANIVWLQIAREQI